VAHTIHHTAVAEVVFAKMEDLIDFGAGDGELAGEEMMARASSSKVSSLELREF
jgi:hypothetical protein